MDIRLKKKITVINEFNKIQVSNADLMKIKKMHVERTQEMKFKDNNKKNVPHNVMAEPVFYTELDAYIYYRDKYEISELKEFGKVAEKYSKLPIIKLHLTEEQTKIKEEYDEQVNLLAQELENNSELRTKLLGKVATDDMPNDISNNELSKKYVTFAGDRWQEYKAKMNAALLNIPLLIAVDTGKANTKVAYNNFNIETGEYGEPILMVFPSLVTEVTSMTTVMDSPVLETGGKKYVVDQTAKPVCSANDRKATGRTKAHEYHRILMIEAHRKVLEETGRSLFNTVVGYSVDSYKSDQGASVYFTMINESISEDEFFERDEKGDFKTKSGKKVPVDKKTKKEISVKLMNDRMSSFTGVDYDITYKGTNATIRINDLILAPETFSCASTFKDIDFTSEEFHNTYIIDMGGLNRSIAIIRNGQRIQDAASTTDKGMSYILSKGTKYLEGNAGDYSENQSETMDISYVEREIKYLNNCKDEDLMEYLFEYFDDLTTELLELKDAALNRNAKLIFVGGVAQYLKTFITTYYTSEEGIKLRYKPIVQENGLYSNVLGMLMAGENQFKTRHYNRLMSA